MGNLKNMAVWPDNNNVHINAHGGGMLHHNGVYHWYGEHKIGGEAGNVAHVGVHVYTSRDLAHWTDAGIALPVSNDPASEITRECVIERPKVIFNAKTGKFVMWFHLEHKGNRWYETSRSGVAVADSPTGPFTYLRSFRPDAGVWPENATTEQKAALPAGRALRGRAFHGGPNDEVPALPILARDFEDGQMSRDMTLFLDDDGKAYHIFSSEENSTLHISLLNDDFLSHAGKYIRVFENRWHEAPAVCKHGGRYWMISSDCTGWGPNAARAATAPTIWGPWRELANPCRGVNPLNGLGPEKTFGGQSTYILPVGETMIAMFDAWRPDDAIDGRYFWLPMRFEDGAFTLEWVENAPRV
ncbi:MAG: glycoside hydrolase family 43 protein [Kiritimatiellaeota bacterium]|nr:glycoside hydrolase family 43 protein [Kiritimatiellota bacterium]